MPNANHRVIAKNTVFLYFRMTLILGVNLYASRVILKMLGVEDVGIYNAVGSIVTLMGFISSSLSAATSRFLTYALGQGKDDEVERIFRVSSTIYYIFALLVVLAAESAGLWMLETGLTIPPARMEAARWCFQLSIVSFVLSFVAIPYNALIIAHERMNAFAYISIVDALARLGVLFLLPLLLADRLVAYAFLLVWVQTLVCFLNALYCFRHFRETNARWLFDRRLSRQLGSYAGWSVMGYAAFVGSNQGLNVLLNHFFNPVVNAARMFALQLQSAVTQFYYNFQLAVRPQIVKTYAQNNMKEMHELVVKSGKYSFLLALIIVAPAMAYTEPLLRLWLAAPPPHLVAFARLTLVACLIGSLSQHTLMAIHATGRIKRFQIVEGLCLLSTLPLAYVAYSVWKCTPETIYAIYVAVEAVTQAVRIAIVYPRINLAYRRFLREIFLPALAASAAVAVIVFVFSRYLPCEGIFAVLGSSVAVALLSAAVVVFTALSRTERAAALQFLRHRLDATKSVSVPSVARKSASEAVPPAPEVSEAACVRSTPAAALSVENAASHSPLFSAVVPAYNAADVVDRCLQSIFDALETDAATLHPDYEVILVDDGSTDATPARLTAWAARYSQIRILTQANAGVSAARNLALQHARGQFVVFADADDALSPNSLSALTPILQQTTADIVICQTHDRGTEYYQWSSVFEAGAAYPPAELLRRGYIRGSVCGCVFRLSFLRANALQFVPGLVFGEDCQFNLEALSCATRVEFQPVGLYEVIGRPDSISRVFTTERIARQTQNVHLLFEHIERIAPQRSSAFVPYMQYMALSCLVAHAIRTPSHSFSQLSSQGYVRLCRSLPSTTALPFMRRKLQLLHYFPRLYYFLAEMKEMIK